LLSRAQINKSITSLDLSYNKLDAEAGKALGVALEVTFHFSVSSLSLTANITSLLCMHFFVQVNTSITELNLGANDLDAEAGKALGKALEVSPIFTVIALLCVSVTSKLR
jgi:hypothetical protein